MLFYVMDNFSEFFFTLSPSNLFTTLTYVLMNNSCPCFYLFLTSFSMYNSFIFFIVNRAKE